MSEITNETPPSTVQNVDDKGKITCHLVSLPKIILTRIDEGNLINKRSSPSVKKPVKRLQTKTKKLPLPSKNSVKKILQNKIVARPRGRPKKVSILTSKLSKSDKRITTIKDERKSKTKLLQISPKRVEKPQGSVAKNMLKKTMLQKRSKIAIPPAKKGKIIPPKTNKPIPIRPTKKVPPKIEVGVPLISCTDSSEDEFLYDELIEELENNPSMRHTGSVKTVVEKTTNITLKPNVGNKPPTIVKGGIIKRSILPADLKPVTACNNFIVSKEIEKPVNLMEVTKTRKNKKSVNSVESPGLTKMPSPWPVSISSPSKAPQGPSKGQKKGTVSKSKVRSTSSVLTTTSKKSQKPLKESQPHLNSTKSPTESNFVKSKPVSLEMGKPKFGPKQTATVVPLSKSLIQDDNLSDEYTEEETLENIDSEPIDFHSKPVSVPTNNDQVVHENAHKMKSTLKPTLQSFDSLKDDEDPHLDLLRILTDDSDELMPLTPLVPKEKTVQSKNSYSNSTGENKSTHNNSPTESSNDFSATETLNAMDEEPAPVRTIYDLMNEIALQYPSWNLHIIPETNAFCIAQVTKGRLGLPTLKKCIELDPVDYNAKVYIHQYHIKRFDGVYDSEESIIALIQEINSIKA